MLFRLKWDVWYDLLQKNMQVYHTNMDDVDKHDQPQDLF